MITKTLVKQGDDYLLVIDDAIMELLGIDPLEPVEVTTEGNRLVITPASASDGQKRFRDSVDRTGGKNAELFRKLKED